MQDGGVEVAELGCDRADRAIANSALVDFDHWRNIGRGAAREDLVGDVELGEVDIAFLHRNTMVAGDLEDGAAIDALENVARRPRREERTTTDDENISSGELAYVAARVEEDAVVVAAVERILLSEDGINVGAVHLRARGNRGVRDASPHARL